VVRVKICGNTDAGHVAACVEAGADAVGFVVNYPTPVPWNLSLDEAGALLPLVPPFVSRAVVMGGSLGDVLAAARFLRPHLVQLHTDNSVSETAEIAKALSLEGIGLIRALRISASTGEACGEIKEPVQAAQALSETTISALLLDARTEGMPAGTGVAVNWDMARAVRQAIKIPLILAGGLTPENVGEAVRQVHPYGVDVISGVETKRCVKDFARVRAFVHAAKLSSYMATHSLTTTA
jgi:phosphoribosylanthranilate isomerase